MTAPRPRPEILDISPYVGGEFDGARRQPRAEAVVQRGRVRRAARRAGGLSPTLAEELHRYPDGDATELRRAIGARFRLDPARIVCGAGSDDLIYQLCLAYGGPGRDIIMSEHGFAIYQIAGTYAGSRVIKTPRARPDGRRGRDAGGGVAGDAAGVPRQPEQPDRQHGAARRGGAAARRPAARGAAGARRRLCRVRRAAGLRSGHPAGRCRRQHRDDCGPFPRSSAWAACGSAGPTRRRR